MLRHALIALFAATSLVADDAVPLSEQPTPFSVWLDFPALRRADAETPALPIWFESFQTEFRQGVGDDPPKTVYRMRLRRLPSLQRQMLIRVFFDDVLGMKPVVTAWSETGRERYRSAAMGIGLGMPTNETAIVPLAGTDYVEIETPGNGSSVRGALVSSLKDVAGLQTIDFQQSPALVDPFGGGSPASPGDYDNKLFGRIRATLDSEITQLSPKDAPSNAWEFDLAAQPLIAVVSFEILNADVTALPVVVANESASAFASIQWPDLADPAYRGESRGGEPAMRFQYTGWLRAQCVIRGADLRSGLNKIIVGLSEDSGPVAIRNVELQLKQNWKHFDYILTPSIR